MNAGWIDVEQCRPAPEVFVLCWDGRKTFVEWFGFKHPREFGVTHWMPYPLPPGATGDMHDGRRAVEAEANAEAKCPESGCSDSIGIAAPAAAVQPMTDDEIAGLWKKWVGTPRPNYSFARAIEGAVKASIGTPAATVQPVAQIQNLAAHGLMYLRERQHGFAEQAFNDILDITSAAVQSDTEREKRRAAVSRLLADKGIYMSNEFVFSLIDAAMGTQPAGKEQP